MRHAPRIALVLCTLAPSFAHGGNLEPTIEELSRLSNPELQSALVSMRDGHNADEMLFRLSTDAGIAADERRDRGAPPKSAGCLNDGEFMLASQIRMARASSDGRSYLAIAREYRALSTRLKRALDDASRTGNWKKNFRALGPWIDDWKHEQRPRPRELLRRTLIGQAIRISLSEFMDPKMFFATRSPVAVATYDEYVFNLMCVADEDNRGWFKADLEANGWYDISRYGPTADRAAWTLVQQADADPDFQVRMVAFLEEKLASGDTNAENLAYLTDRVAVRLGQPQRYATQIECVNGEWQMPKIADPDKLEARRASMGLVPYEEQLRRARNLCRKH